MSNYDPCNCDQALSLSDSIEEAILYVRKQNFEKALHVLRKAQTKNQKAEDKYARDVLGLDKR